MSTATTTVLPAYGSGETATEPYPYESVAQAVRAYVHGRERASSVPSLDGAHLESTSGGFSAWGQPVEAPHYVYMPMVDGGPGSQRDATICGYLSVESCLPTDPTQLRVLLARCVYPLRHCLRVLTEWSGERWHRRRLYRVWAAAYDDTEYRLRQRGLIPPGD